MSPDLHTLLQISPGTKGMLKNLNRPGFLANFTPGIKGMKSKVGESLIS